MPSHLSGGAREECPPSPRRIDEASGVHSFATVNEQLWQLPTTATGGVDWDTTRGRLEEAPEERCRIAGRFFFTWLNPYIDLAARERFEEAYMPPPQRPHRAVYCGALLSRAFREEEVRGGRDRWRARVEATALRDGAVCVVAANALAAVQFRGEAGVRGRLRWVGYLRSSDASHVLLGGVEWDGESALPRYRQRYVGEGGEAVHDGAVHGERLFHQLRRGPALCTCEYVTDLVPLEPGAGEGVDVKPVRCATPRAPSLLLALFRTFTSDIIAVFTPAVVGMVCELATPWLLQEFVLFLQSDKTKTSANRGVAMFALFCVLTMIKPLAFNKRIHRARRVSSLFRSATLGVIFEKCFTVSPDALAHPVMSTGRILTMASSDVENIKHFPRVMAFLFTAPTMLVVYLAYLFTLVGASVCAGAAVFVLSLPLQAALTRVLEGKQDSLSSCTDQRLRRTNELLSGIRVVKTMGWEAKFVTAIDDDARQSELRHLRSVQLADIVLSAIVHATPSLMIAAVLTAYTLSGHVLEPAVVLPVIAVINAVTYPIIMLPEAFTSLAKFIVSTGRITQFLECDDAHVGLTLLKGDADSDRKSDGTDGTAAAWFDDVTVLASVPTALPAYEPRHRGLRHVAERLRCAVLRIHVPVELQWRRAAETSASASTTAATNTSSTTTSADEVNTAAAAVDAEVEQDSEDDEEDGGPLYTMEDKALLRGVTVAFPRGQLTVVVGATGSGKSVLLSTLLGAFRFRGRVGVVPSIAYVPQQPWIMQETVQANITFFEGDQRGDSARSDGGSGGAGLACSPLRGGGGGGAAAGGVRGARVDFGSDRLGDAVRCCQLEADLALLAKGLATEIGEKGINLSGGQKARVSLARAVYADCDMYVLDDPLSALDAHVGRHVMEDVVLRALGGKTRVLVTHQLHVLPYADQVVVVRDGGVVFAGSYGAYAESEWKAYVENEEEKQAAREERKGTTTVEEELAEDASNDFSPAGSPVQTDDAPSAATARGDNNPCKNTDREKAVHVASGSVDDGVTRDGDADGRDDLSAEDGGGALMSAEEKETGHIPWAVYQQYVQAGGGVAQACRIAGAYFMGDSLYHITNVWLTLWSVQYFGQSLRNNTQLAIFLLLTFLVQFVLLVNEFFFYAFSRRAARRLHATLLYTISSATVTFFDRTPLGRIVNRFSKDVYVLDDELPGELASLIAIADTTVLSFIVTICASPPTIVVVVIACAVFARLIKFYTTVVREVRRRGSVVQSPLFSLLEEVVQGRATIAAYGKSHALFTEALRRLDLVYSCTYVEQTVTLWLSVRIEYMAAVIIMLVGIIGIAEKMWTASAVMSEARVGLLSLSLTMCLDLSWSLCETVESAASVEASMNSVQRVCHYIDHVPQEALLLEPSDAYVAAALAGGAGAGAGVRASDVVIVDGGSGSGSGGARRGDADFGALRLEHVSLRYRPGLPLVLRDVSFAIAPGQKVGVVGRTGSGKSTLLLAFLRLVEVCGGRMVVCGRDAQAYTLPALRRLFSMIPQDPVLFDGTIRSNVDPFGDATDAEVRRALASVGFVSSTADGGADGGSADSAASAAAGGAGVEEVPALETVVQEGGSNFSVGQRQLLCLARALLKKGSAFILMDEATANVDARLDQTVQRVVAEQFRDYTVVTIAHRLHTVAAYDMILVMAHGRVVEYGSPRSLLQDRASVFYGMVAQSSAVVAAAVAGDGGREGAGSGGLSAEERQRRVEEVVATFLQDCK